MFEGAPDGEFWYELNLESLNPEVVYMSLMECEVGRYLQSKAMNLRFSYVVAIYEIYAQHHPLSL